MAGASAASGRARIDAYSVALDDVPSWAVATAITKWHRGDCGSDMNYTFAPAPAILRDLAKRELEPVALWLNRMQSLLAATDFETAYKGSNNAQPS